ncbi:heparin lyase I family protein [Zobellia alginiliquefaciens]|uniref:heparin lyase I family protein n=1 Tax=Zobellia alginiliquefaciens TaxID=3032586 RepID=UPI0023E407B9|nr:heparin lyase I family protein [Zobellia alginiliquefaciens]
MGYLSVDDLFPSSTLSKIPEKRDGQSNRYQDCISKGGSAKQTGLKEWCWQDVDLPTYSGKKGATLIQNQLSINSECSEGQITVQDKMLKFRVEPTNPQPRDWCSNEYNFRAELSTSPWPVNHEKGTEEWFGWTYTFGDDYIVDSKIPWLFFQVHEGTVGLPPLVALWCMNENGPGSGKVGEIHVVNNAERYKNKYFPTGVTPVAGQTISVVVHIVYGDAFNGLLQVWINGNMVHDRKARTVRASNEVGGNAKWGIYKWRWSKENGVRQSAQQNIHHLETYLGPLKIVTRKANDLEYGKSAYSLVSPE